MKKAVIFFLIIPLIPLSILAQEGYTSDNNSTGFWTDAGIWSRSQNWMPTTPGTDVGGATGFVDIYGYVVRSGNLTLRGMALLTVYDTLWITGNFNVTQSSSIDVRAGGILVVDGNMTCNGGTSSTNNGNIIVKGRLTSSGSARVNNHPGGTDGFYVYGPASGSGGASFNGSPNTSSANLLDESDLSANNSSLYNFVHATLPVRLISTDASFDGEKVKVIWSTSSELNNDRFEIYRSTNEVDFKYLGEVPGHGTTTDLIEYTFVDDCPVIGTSYYKIKQVDFEGEHTYFPPVAVHVNPSSIIFQVIPTIIKEGNVKLKIGNINHHTVRITLNALKGNLAFDKTFFLKKGIIRKIELTDTDQLQNGIYIITLYTGRNQYRKKVIIGR